MKKYLYALPCLGTTLLLSLGAAFPAAAASGWVSDGGVWRYQEASGNYASSTWKTSGNGSYYLGSDGKMAVSQWVDDMYYVDENGARCEIPGSM